jgi:hypothetical protein
VQAGEEVGQRLLQRQRDRQRADAQRGQQRRDRDAQRFQRHDRREHRDRDADDAARDAQRRPDAGLRAAYSVSAATAMRDRPSAHASTNRMSNAAAEPAPEAAGQGELGQDQHQAADQHGAADRHAQRRRRRLSGRSPPGPLSQRVARCATSRARRRTAPAARAGRSGRRLRRRIDVDSRQPGHGLSYILFPLPMGTKPSKSLETFPNPKRSATT